MPLASTRALPLDVSALFAGAVCASAAATQIERMLAAIAVVIEFRMTLSSADFRQKGLDICVALSLLCSRIASCRPRGGGRDGSENGCLFYPHPCQQI